MTLFDEGKEINFCLSNENAQLTPAALANRNTVVAADFDRLNVDMHDNPHSPCYQLVTLDSNKTNSAPTRDFALAERAQPLLLALPHCSVLLVGFAVLAISAVPIKDSMLPPDLGDAIRVLDGALHIPGAYFCHFLVGRPAKIGIGKGELGCRVIARSLEHHLTHFQL